MLGSLFFVSAFPASGGKGGEMGEKGVEKPILL